jgi:hypothetical protein
VGTQDSFRDAQGFVERHGITFRMLWEDGFESWRAFGIVRQPASILASPEGARIKKWQGSLDEAQYAEVRQLIGA